MIVRRPTPSNFAASVCDSPNPVRQSAKSTPVIGSCSSAIRRNVEAETSSRPYLVWTGQASPRPSSTIDTLAKESGSSISGAKCAPRAISPVKSSLRSRRSPAKRTSRTRPPAGRALVILVILRLTPVTSASNRTTMGLSATGASPGTNGSAAVACFPTAVCAGVRSGSDNDHAPNQSLLVVQTQCRGAARSP
jgi:hypothetical protein